MVLETSYTMALQDLNGFQLDPQTGIAYDGNGLPLPFTFQVGDIDGQAVNSAQYITLEGATEVVKELSAAFPSVTFAVKENHLDGPVTAHNTLGEPLIEYLVSATVNDLSVDENAGLVALTIARGGQWKQQIADILAPLGVTL
jgi:hypothetical protein